MPVERAELKQEDMDVGGQGWGQRSGVNTTVKSGETYAVGYGMGKEKDQL